ncbi:MAG TPA: metallophosphoesterase [Acetobacteraceae bacterium]|jgi:3',5'-cyclic AMP phosphodiesterase CpdA
MGDETGQSRRGLLKCMAWAGGGVVWTVVGGVPRSGLIGSAQAADGFSFVQLSDSHIGFSRDPNTDVPATLQEGVNAIKALGGKPALLIHTGDVSHLSKPAQFDTAAQIIGGAGLEGHYVPGEHDVLEDEGAGFIARFQKDVRQGKPGGGFYSFDQEGVHFIGLNNVVDLQAGGMGNLGEAQLAWLAGDLDGRSASQPIVVFAHIPLWTIAPEWGWGTADSTRALGLLKRFGSVTVLNGHIHQVMQKVEGNVAFHTARSTAFPQPAPGTAKSPGPMHVEPGQLRSVLGVTNVAYVPGTAHLAIVDTTLAA